MNLKKIIALLAAVSVISSGTACGSYGKGEKPKFSDADAEFEYDDDQYDDTEDERKDDEYNYAEDDADPNEVQEVDPDEYEVETVPVDPPEPETPEVVTEPVYQTEANHQETPEQKATAAVPPTEPPKPDVSQGAVPPVFTSFSSSSNLADVTTSAGSYSYKPDYAFDGNLSSCWCEGASGSGEGEYILASANGLQHVSQLNIYNGLCENADLFGKNNRIKDCILEFSNGTSYTVTLNGDYNAQPCAVVLPEAVDTEYVKLTIMSVYNGSKYDDTCISEIIIN